ncbi:hypothetical protein RR48_00442 [Papilio machaon]|uniref:Uncharacterized protein n=1 Tax=Papilio machaon TaxID=76193 RepID=A0A0N1IL32_PAPMA|nr:hypothetical protein RR48_00442 [Papilio machaon]
MGSPVFNYMASNTIKTPPVGQPPYQVSIEERMRWAQIAEAMAQANHYAVRLFIYKSIAPTNKGQCLN